MAKLLSRLLYVVFRFQKTNTCLSHFTMTSHIAEYPTHVDNYHRQKHYCTLLQCHVRNRLLPTHACFLTFKSVVGFYNCFRSVNVFFERKLKVHGVVSCNSASTILMTSSRSRVYFNMVNAYL